MVDSAFSRPPLPSYLQSIGPRTVAVLGSTGSIGTQALALAAAHPEQFTINALGAGSQWELLAEQAVSTGAALLGIADTTAAQALATRVAELARAAGKTGYQPEIIAGPEAMTVLAGQADAEVVLNAVTGSRGLEPTLAALSQQKMLALANKESLIVGGRLVTDTAAQGQLIPVDSEHSAIAQCLWGGSREEVQRLILTASGGPFRGYSREQLAAVTPADALNHPVWNMGQVITTNSATLVNKALEVIEAHLLFDIPLDRCDVVVHPEHFIHSMVQFHDGAVLAQISTPDMALPIALGMNWPHRLAGAVRPLDFTTATRWHFEPVDEETFPAIGMAKAAAAASATHMAVFNAANEEAVAGFHSGRISFPAITATVEKVVSAHEGTSPENVSLEAVLAAERWARTYCQELMGKE